MAAEPLQGMAGDEGDVALAALPGRAGTSVRLATMLAKPALGRMTLRAFHANRREVVAWMARQPNCGRTTIAELERLVDAKPPPRGEPAPPEEAFPLDDVELGELLADDEPSARLAEVLRTALRTTRLSQYVGDRGRVEATMMLAPNCGRRSVTELRRLVGGHVRGRLRDRGIETSRVGDALRSLVEAAPEEERERDGPPADRDLRSTIDWHLGRLPERTADVLRRRNGLDGSDPMTLAEIGDVYGITRERVRQVEAKGLKAIASASRRLPIRPLVDEASPQLLDAVFGASRHVEEAAAGRALSALAGWLRLALEISHGGGEAWLRRHARRLGSGWLAPGRDAAETRAVASELRRRAKGRPFPRAATELWDGLDPTIAVAAMELLLDWRLVDGYAVDRRPGARLRRTIRLHALLSGETRPLEMAPLLRRYHAAAPHDPCTDRDLVIVMETASHLFLEIHEGCWSAIGSAAPRARAGRTDADPTEEARGDATPPTADPQEPSAGDAGTIAGALERELARAGPSRLGDLMARAIDVLPEGRSRHSVGPTLVLNPTRFVRILPGVYALPRQVLDGRDLVHAGDAEYLLNPTQARFYAVARKSGEPWGSYPLWTPTAEMRLCRWARAGDDRGLLRSLLDVASIGDWPTDDADRGAWSELKAKEARFELWSEQRPAGARPPLDRVLAAAIRLERSGTIGWVAANRILGYVPSSYAGASLLDGMVAAGIAARPAVEHGWQLPHEPGHDLARWTSRLSGALHDSGEIDWRKGPGAELAARFSDEGGGGGYEVDPFEGMDEYERVMAEHRAAMRSRRLEAMLELADE